MASVATFGLRSSLARGSWPSVAQATISKYLPPKPRRPPSPTWRTFWNNHRSLIAAVNFFVVPTATFRLLYCFLVLTPDRRRVAHFNVTSHPSALWTALQIVEAFPFGAAPKHLVRDYDGIYGNAFQERMKHLGIEEVRITPRSPWHNPYVERLIGTIRRPLVSLRLTQPVRLGLQKPVERLFHVRPHHLADMTPKLRLLNTNNAVKASLIRKTC